MADSALLRLWTNSNRISEVRLSKNALAKIRYRLGTLPPKIYFEALKPTASGRTTRICLKATPPGMTSAALMCDEVALSLFQGDCDIVHPATGELDDAR